MPSLALMFDRRKVLGHRLLSAADLAIDFATLGEYGLEPVPAEGYGRERRGRQAAWEALTTARRGRCASTAADRAGFATAAARRRHVRRRELAY